VVVVEGEEKKRSGHHGFYSSIGLGLGELQAILCVCVRGGTCGTNRIGTTAKAWVVSGVQGRGSTRVVAMAPVAFLH
jgi:hypothetical protein